VTQQDELVLVGGEVVLSYNIYAGPPPVADKAIAFADLEIVIPAVLDQLAGWLFSSHDDELTAALLDAGATMVRHGHTCIRQITGDDVTLSPRPTNFELSPITASTTELAELSLAAYIDGHVDFDATYDPSAELEDLFAGRILGPYLAQASFQVVDDGCVVGAIIVNDRIGDPPYIGPWVSEIFRDRNARYRGLGSVLLESSIQSLAQQRRETLGLVVTNGNPASTLYERTGFNRVLSARKLLIPAST